MSAVTHRGPQGPQDVSFTELYVYYRVHTDEAGSALAAFETARAGEPVRLLKRRDHDPVFQTWMEIYAPPLADATGTEVRVAAAMGSFAQGPRHREAFAHLAGPVGGA